MITLKTIDWKKLLLCLALPLGVGLLAGFLTRNSMEAFQALIKPPLSPPGWLFPVVWALLYIAMGVASYLVLTSDRDPRAISASLRMYGIQLAVNFLWPLFFFLGQAYFFSFLWILLLWALVILTTLMFYGVSKGAGWLFLPYLIWVTFAAYLNLGIFLLN